jgi:predicted metal-dependent phosphoesterase TrpH
MCTIPVLKRYCRESYNDPLALYETLKRRGMHIVTVTDHDSVGAADALRRFPDFFVSEEVTCILPGGTEAHIAVYDITERQHVEIQARRNEVPRLIAYLREQDLLFGVNHAFSALTGRRQAADFALFESEFPLLETRNGHIPARSNRTAERTAERWGKIATAGSEFAHHGPSDAIESGVLPRSDGLTTPPNCGRFLFLPGRRGRRHPLRPDGKGGEREVSGKPF